MLAEIQVLRNRRLVGVVKGKMGRILLRVQKELWLMLKGKMVFRHELLLRGDLSRMRSEEEVDLVSDEAGLVGEV